MQYLGYVWNRLEADASPQFFRTGLPSLGSHTIFDLLSIEPVFRPTFDLFGRHNLVLGGSPAQAGNGCRTARIVCFDAGKIVCRVIEAAGGKFPFGGNHRLALTLETALLPCVPADTAGRREHDGERDADDKGSPTLPERGKSLLLQLLIDFTDELV